MDILVDILKAFRLAPAEHVGSLGAGHLTERSPQMVVILVVFGKFFPLKMPFCVMFGNSYIVILPKKKSGGFEKDDTLEKRDGKIRVIQLQNTGSTFPSSTNSPHVGPPFLRTNFGVPSGHLLQNIRLMKVAALAAGAEILVPKKRDFWRGLGGWIFHVGFQQ